MFLELIATFAAALGVAGIVLILNRLTGGRLPKWAMPVAAGLTILGFTIWSEYTWARRTIAELPEGAVVVEQVSDSAIYKPWTYLAPQVTRMIVLDIAGMQTNPDTPDIRLIELYFFARWRAPQHVPQLVDCARVARADVADAALADPATADWVDLHSDDPIIRQSCKSTS